MRIRRVTLDTNCINAKGKNEALNTLEGWARHGLLDLQRSDALLKELDEDKERVAKAVSMPAHPRPFVLNESRLDDPDYVLAGPDHVLVGPDQVDLQALLFPTAHPMTDKQKKDVEHLELHVLTGGDVFVTLDRKDFIARGRQKKLRACGIWVMQPSELTELLESVYGWR